MIGQLGNLNQISSVLGNGYGGGGVDAIQQLLASLTQGAGGSHCSGGCCGGGCCGGGCSSCAHCAANRSAGLAHGYS